MNESIARILLERDWSSPEGLYADLSKGKPEYYVKCPRCKVVHGMFPTADAAVYNKLCGTCQFERINQVKSDLEKMGKPVKPGKRKVPWPLSTK